MRLRIYLATTLLSLSAQADQTRRLTPPEKTWTWMSILNSDSATESMAMLHEHGVSEGGAKRLLKYIEDAFATQGLANTMQILKFCDQSAQFMDPEALAREFERWGAEEAAERDATIEGIAGILNPDDLRGFEESVQTLRNASAMDSDIPANIRAGRMTPPGVVHRACENADELRRTLQQHSESAATSREYGVEKHHDDEAA